MTGLARAIASHPGRVLGAVAAITAVALAGIVDPFGGGLRLRLDPAIERLMSEDADVRRDYDEMVERFGSDHTLTLALASPELLTDRGLERIAGITERLEAHPAVRGVLGLATALDIRGVGEELVVEPFYTGPAEAPASAAAIAERVEASPVYSGTLLSADRRTTAIVVDLHPMPEREFTRQGIDRQIAAIAREAAPGWQVWLTGPPRIRAETSRVLLSDLRFVIPAAFGIAGLIALATFRSARGVLIPLSTIAVALLWTLGAMGFSGSTLNIVTTILPPLILCIGLAYAVHVLAAYQAAGGAAPDAPGDSGGRARERVRRALDEVGGPVILTGLTTCAGFLALTASPLGAIREFGIFATVGVVATALAALTYVPALLALLPEPRGGPEPTHRAGWFDRAMERLAAFDLRHARVVIGVWIALCGLAVWGASRIQVSNDMVANFGPDAEVRTEFEAVNRRLGGANPFYVTVRADARDAFKDPGNLEALEAFQAWLDEQPEIGSSISLVDYVKALNWGFHDNRPAYLAVPETAALTDQLLFFGGSEELERFVDSRYQRTRILARSTASDTASLRELTRRVEARLAELPANLEGAVTGDVVLVAAAMDDIAGGQIQSLSLAFLAIFVILAFLFASVRVGFIALIPNAIPVLLYFGLMGWFDVRLNVVTGLVACIVLGIAVDDSIHYLSRFASAARHHGDERRGAVTALRSVGAPITATTVALCLGFLTLTQTNLRTQVHFGALGAATLALAWLVDLTLTPALSSRLRIVNLWDLLTLDLGPDPHRTIPIFRGLRRAQARLVALMMTLRSLPKGERLFRAGAAGDDLYVVIDGELSVRLATPEGGEELGRLRRGDVVGEVGIFHGRRTADVESLSDARLLRLDWAGLERLRRRYPRVAARVYRNLSEVLAGRLAGATDRERSRVAGESTARAR